MVITLKSLSGRLLISTPFNSFSEVLPYSSVSSFCLILCVYFYVLDRSFKFPDLEEEALCRRHTMGPGNTLPSGLQSYTVPACWWVGPGPTNVAVWPKLSWDWCQLTGGG